MALKYRSDIDGLRAVAVLPVVLFHAGIPGFSGGYIGVDVFFVISGYLITTILLREMVDGNYSLLRFYERRIRRIFPALIFMVSFVLLVSPFALLPSELRALPLEVIGTIFFFANIVFWRGADYFATAAEEKPLLHMWSLGVEEQFYIFAPFALWLIVRYALRAKHAVILACLLSSLAMCIILTPSLPSASFYLLPTRAWELLAGSLIAAGLPKPKDAHVSGGLAGVGLIMIVGAVFAFDPGIEFPGYLAIIPVLGAVLVIQFAQGTFVDRVLSAPFLVWIGLISYSLYLWHWPLTVFFRDWSLLNGMTGRIAVVALSVAAAWVSWRFVELPFRNASRWPARRLVTTATGAAAAICVAAVGIQVSDGWESRFPATLVAYDNARDDISPDRGACHISGGLRAPDRWCRLGDPMPEVAVWGDSHGVEIARALSEAGLPIVQITYSACPPAMGYSPATRPDCATHNQMVFEHLLTDPSIKTVIVAANYRLYPDEVSAGFAEYVAHLRGSGKTVIILGQIPTPGHNVPSMLASGITDPFQLPPEAAAATASLEGVFSYGDVLCPDGVCPLTVVGMPLLFDDGHLSMTAARFVAPMIVSTFAEVLEVQSEPARVD